MALVYCPDCGSTVSERAPACPKCGCPIAAEVQASRQSSSLPQPLVPKSPPPVPPTTQPYDPLRELAQAQARPGAANYQSPTVIVQNTNVVGHSGYACRVCGCNLPAKKRRKGSVLLMLLLLLLWVIPGIVYAIVTNGYVWVCPNCKAKIANA